MLAPQAAGHCGIAIPTPSRHTMVVAAAKIYKKGQITIPKAVRKATGLEIGDRVVVEARRDEVVVRRALGVLEFEPPQAEREPLAWPQARAAARAARAARHRSTDE